MNCSPLILSKFPISDYEYFEHLLIVCQEYFIILVYLSEMVVLNLNVISSYAYNNSLVRIQRINKVPIHLKKISSYMLLIFQF